MANKYQRPKLNKLQATQLKDIAKQQPTVLIKKVPKEFQKGFSDLPLFNIEQPKLF